MISLYHKAQIILTIMYLSVMVALAYASVSPLFSFNLDYAFHQFYGSSLGFLLYPGTWAFNYEYLALFWTLFYLVALVELYFDAQIINAAKKFILNKRRIS